MYRYTVEERVFIVRTYWKSESKRIYEEIWRTTAAIKTLHSLTGKEIRNYGHVVGCPWRRTSKNVSKHRLGREEQTSGITAEVLAQVCAGVGFVKKFMSMGCKSSSTLCISCHCGSRIETPRSAKEGCILPVVPNIYRRTSRHIGLQVIL